MSESAEIPGGAATENAAVKWVLNYEKHHGRVAHDARYQGEAVDVISSDRVIEIKAFGKSARGSDLFVEVSQVEEARKNPAFHLYVVDNIRQGDPAKFRLIDLHGETLAKLLEHAKEQRYFVVPFPVGVYDTAVRAND